MSEYNNALEYIGAYIDNEKTIEYGDDEFIVKVNENVDIDDVYNAINTIVDNVVEREFEYELIDLILPYYLITLFTDISAPTITDDGIEHPDYEMCYKIATIFNLEYELTQTSPLVAGYIYLITQNIWRRLDYQKSQGAFLKRDLMDALSAFYEVIDELDKINEQQKDVDIEGFMSQLYDISKTLAEYQEKDNDIVHDETTSVAPIIPEAKRNNK